MSMSHKEALDRFADTVLPVAWDLARECEIREMMVSDACMALAAAMAALAQSVGRSEADTMEMAGAVFRLVELQGK